MAPTSSHRCHCNRTICACGGDPYWNTIFVAANEPPKPSRQNPDEYPNGWRKPRHGKHARQRK